MKKLLIGLVTLLFVLSCGGSKEGENGGSSDTSKKVEKLVVGATPVPHQELLELMIMFNQIKDWQIKVWTQTFSNISLTWMNLQRKIIWS